jgi:hypothetical protein
MIRYDVSAIDLEQAIEKQSPGWIKKAADRTKAFKKKKKYSEKSSIWSAVKPAYMKLQGNSKCAYCERKLESVDLGKIEQDVEHFRPKGSVKPWKAPKALADEGVKFAKAPPVGKGYYLLPYHPFNYAAACKPCNSALKKDYFPIAGTYNLRGADPKSLRTERPYLIYPIGDVDDDAEKMIEFYGVSPRPVAKAGHARNRALVTIEFFKLDDADKRKNLLRERAIILVALCPQLEKMRGQASATEKTQAKSLVNSFMSSNMPHTNCARSFRRLFESNLSEARALAQVAAGLLATIS